MHPTRSIKLLFLSIKRNKVSGSGPKGPGQIKKRKRKLQAASAKLQA
tara:strand:- start:271 stop:411 length:141 start_codon:yes stop_codon:yes gene_type:complete